MKAMRIAIAFLVAAAMTTVATTMAVAQPQVVQLGCDTLSFQPPRVHVPFSVINLTTIPICSVHLIPIPSGPFEPCQIFDCSHPPGWECGLDTDSTGTPLGGAHWNAFTGGPCIRPFEKGDGFDIIIDPPYCCYHTQFDDGTGHIFYEGIACFNCESPVEVKVGSWGQLKMKYR